MKTTIVKGLTALSLSALLCLGSFLGASVPPAMAASSLFKSAQTTDTPTTLPGYLLSWEDGPNKEAIIDFVEGPAQKIPVEDRIAVFDNDGTLWAEKPNYFQLDYIASKTRKELLQPMTVEEYRADVLSFLETTQQQGNEVYPSFGVPYMQLTYQPMIELVQYLQANDFSVFICSGGGMDFVRAFSEDAYGIPSQNVIGSVTINHYERDTREVLRSGGTPVIVKPDDMITALKTGAAEDFSYADKDYNDGGYPTPAIGSKNYLVNPFNDKEGKPVGIERYLGKKPIMAVGNSDGDFFMFDYTDSNGALKQYRSKPLIVLLNHDAECSARGFIQGNNDCEYTYNSDVDLAAPDDSRQDFCEKPEYCSLAVAENKPNWLVVSMKNDFKRIFPWNS